MSRPVGHFCDTTQTPPKKMQCMLWFVTYPYENIRPTRHGLCTGHIFPTQARPREKLELEYLKFHKRCPFWVLNVEQLWLSGG